MTAQTQEELLAAHLEEQKIDVLSLPPFLSVPDLLFHFLTYSLKAIEFLYVHMITFLLANVFIATLF